MTMPDGGRLIAVTVAVGTGPIRYVLAGPGCTPDAPPAGGKYPAGATGLFVAAGAGAFVGTSSSGVFYYRDTTEHPHLEEMLADFLCYEHAHGRVPILFGLEGDDVEARVAAALRRLPPPNVVRPSDPPYLVHSTSRAAGRQIRRDGAILSFTRLREQGRAPAWHRLRSSCLGEPPEFDDYVNLGCPGTPWVEVVPASHTAGRFLGPDDPYEPGWRFYFDAARLIAAGRITRWCGGLRVRGVLLLEGFCISQIDVGAVDPGEAVSRWTPRLFTEMADRLFSRQQGR